MPVKDLRFKPDYQPWNEEEFWADVYVQAMPRRAASLYKNLLNAAFFCSTRPHLLTADDELCLNSHAESMDEWMQYKSIILKRFRKKKISGKWLWTHKRVAEDWERIRAKREQQAAAGSKGGSVKRTTSERLTDGNQTPSSKLSEVSQESKTSKTSKESKYSQEEVAAMLSKFECFVSVWQEYHGKAAMCLAPINRGDYKNRDRWMELWRAHGAIMLDAFTLWAKEQAAEGSTTKYPATEFMKVAGDYMQRVSPLLTTGVKEKHQKAVEDRVAVEKTNLYAGIDSVPAPAPAPDEEIVL